jgi:hypothetical protein
MSTRTLTLILAVLALLLSISWWARSYYGAQRCERFGKVYQTDKGCVDPPKGRPILLERGLTRT